MATHKSQYLSDAVLKVARGVTFPSVPASFYLALLSTAPTKNDMTSAVELIVGTSPGYGRLAVTPNTTNFGAPSQQGDFVTEKTLSLVDLTFATPSGNGLTIVAFAIYDASTSGNVWWYGDLTANIPWTNGVPVIIPAGSLSISES